MAIAIEQDQAVEQEQVIRVDIRQFAAAATFCRKARPKFRHDIAAWRENVLVHGAYMYGGDPYETTVQAPHGGEYAHRAFAVPYDSIVAAAKGRKGTAELRAGSITFDDSATFAWKDDAAAADDMQSQRGIGVDEGGFTVDYDGATFRDAVAMVAPSASKDDSRPVLTGVYVDPDAGKWCATDSYRMMIANVPHAEGFDRFGDGGAIVPPSALRIAAAVKGADYYQVSIGGSNDAYVNRYAEILAGLRVDTFAASVVAVIRTRLVDGQYPNYSALVPDGFAFSVDCDGDALRAALQSAASVARKNAPIVLTADSSRDYVLVEAGSGDDARGEWRVPCLYVGDTAEPFRFGVNAEYARDGAECVGGDVSLNLTDPLRPLLMTRTDAYQADIVAHYVVMPIRL
jgi:DNA polymerase III sliding clamp (beta) subunit (PCNA family)